jgi:hypothetical protein
LISTPKATGQIEIAKKLSFLPQENQVITNGLTKISVAHLPFPNIIGILTCLHEIAPCYNLFPKYKYNWGEL